MLAGKLPEKPHPARCHSPIRSYLRQKDQYGQKCPILVEVNVTPLLAGNCGTISHFGLML